MHVKVNRVRTLRVLNLEDVRYLIKDEHMGVDIEKCMPLKCLATLL